MEVNESLDALEQIYAELDPMNCCQSPTVPPNMAFLTAKSLFQFHHILGDPHAKIVKLRPSLSTIPFSDQRNSYVTIGSESFAIGHLSTHFEESWINQIPLRPLQSLS